MTDSVCARAPSVEQIAEVCAVDLVVDEQIRETLATVGNRVEIKVGHAGGKFARVADTVIVAVVLQRIGDGGTIVGGVGASVAVGVEWWRALDCDGVD